MKIIKAKDYNDMSRKAANIISAQVIMKPDCVLGLATGSTPIGTYKQLIEWYEKGDLDFGDVTTVNLDEYRGLPRENDQSYFYFMNHNLFDYVNVNPERTHLPNGMNPDADAECKRYEEVIRSTGGVDLQLLGLGHNGHIGFNEPDSYFTASAHKVELAEETIKANARFFEKESDVPRSAITMGMYGIATAAKVILVATGAAKAPAIKKLLESDHVDPQLPCSILHICEDATVIVDKDLYELTK